MQTGPVYDSTIGYTYDGGNRLTQIADSIAGTFSRGYDNFDRLTSEAGPQGLIGYGYDAYGRRTSMTAGGQSAVTYGYDNANRLTQITQGSSTVSFGYDIANRRATLTLPNGVVMTYGYDNATELTGLNYSLGGNTLGNLTYSYDQAGRRTAVGGSLATVNLPNEVSVTAYNADNQLTQWGTAFQYYDANGNMTSDGTNSFVWNSRNQLASMNFTSNTFQYDPFGRRQGKSILGASTNFLYDGSNVVQELSGSTPTVNLLTGGIDEVFTRTDSSGTANFLTDALGSTLALTDSAGNALAQYAYGSFGNTTVTAGSSSNEFQYTGRENDGTGVYFYRGRYYSPTLQRFLSEDPAGIVGGINLYAYAANNPIQFIDPFGFDKKDPMSSQLQQTRPQTQPQNIGAQQKPKQPLLVCAAETANKLSLAQLAGTNGKSGFFNSLVNGVLGNTFSTVFSYAYGGSNVEFGTTAYDFGTKATESSINAVTGAAPITDLGLGAQSAAQISEGLATEGLGGILTGVKLAYDLGTFIYGAVHCY